MTKNQTSDCQKRQVVLQIFGRELHLLMRCSSTICSQRSAMKSAKMGYNITSLFRIVSLCSQKKSCYYLQKTEVRCPRERQVSPTDRHDKRVVKKCFTIRPLAAKFIQFCFLGTRTSTKTPRRRKQKQSFKLGQRGEAWPFP